MSAQTLIDLRDRFDHKSRHDPSNIALAPRGSVEGSLAAPPSDKELVSAALDELAKFGDLGKAAIKRVKRGARS